MVDQRYVPDVRAVVGRDQPASVVSVQQAILQLSEMIHKLEGRLGPIALRDSLVVDGDLSLTGDLTAPSSINVGEGVVSTAPALSTDGTGKIYFDGAKFQVSEDEGAWVDLIPTPVASKNARVYSSANQSIADTTFTAITFNSELYDTSNFHSTSSDNTKIVFTADTEGKYHVGATVLYGTSAGSGIVGIRLNGSTILAYATGTLSGTFNAAVHCSADYEFVAGDYIEVIAYQDSGGSLNSVSLLHRGPGFWIHSL